MTQPRPTLPSGFSTSLGSSTECTLPPLVFVSILLVLLPDRKVVIQQGANDSPTMTSPTPTRVVSDQLLCQLDQGGFDVDELVGAGVMFHQDESVCYCHI